MFKVNKQNKTKDLTEGSPIKLLITFMIPILFGYLFQQFYTVADSIIVGRLLGPDALAGVGSTSSVTFLVLVSSIGICSGFSIPVAQSFGKKDFSELRRLVGNVIVLTSLIAIIITAVTSILCGDILTFMHNPKETFTYAYQYLLICFLGIPATMAYNMAANLMRALGDSKTPLYFLFLSSAVNIILDLVLISFTPLGVMGAALATVSAQLLAAILAIIYMAKTFDIIKICKEDLKVRKNDAIRLLSSGLPVAMQTSVTAIGTILLQSSVNDLGPAAMTSFTAGDKVMIMMISPMDAIGTALASFVGQNVGAKKFKRVSEGVRASSIMGIAYCVFAILLALILGETMISWFIDSESALFASEIIKNGTDYLITGVALYLPLLYIHILRNTIQAMGYSNFAVFGGALELLGRGSMGIYFVPAFGFAAVCFASPLAWVFADLFFIPMYFILLRRIKRKYEIKEGSR